MFICLTLLGLGSFDSTIVGNTMINTKVVDFAFLLTSTPHSGILKMATVMTPNSSVTAIGEDGLRPSTSNIIKIDGITSRAKFCSSKCLCTYSKNVFTLD